MGVPALLAVTALSAGVQAAGAIKQGQAQKAAADYQAQIATMNSQIAQQNANNATQVGEQQQINQQMKTRATVGGILAAQGANNLDVNSGSQLDVKTSAQEMGQLDALTIRNNASRQAWNYEVQGATDTAQAGLYNSEGSSDQLAGFLNAGSSLLSGASSVGSKYLQFSQYNASDAPDMNYDVFGDAERAGVI